MCSDFWGIAGILLNMFWRLKWWKYISCDITCLASLHQYARAFIKTHSNCFWLGCSWSSSFEAWDWQRIVPDEIGLSMSSWSDATNIDRWSTGPHEACELPDGKNSRISDPILWCSASYLKSSMAVLHAWFISTSSHKSISESWKECQTWH